MIDYKPLKAENIPECARRMCQIANENNQIVQAMYNGICIEAGPEDPPSFVIDSYLTERDRLCKRTEHRLKFPMSAQIKTFTGDPDKSAFIKVALDGTPNNCYYERIEHLDLMALFEGCDIGDGYTLTLEELTEEEFAALPEFMGF